MKILLVRLRLIGDVVFTTPVIRAVRRRYPAAHLAYLVESAAQPIVSTNPHLSETITIAHRRGWRRVRDDLRVGNALRRRKFDLVIDLHGGPRSAWLTWATRAPVRVGYDVPGRTWMYTRAVERPRGWRPRHAVENQWDLLTAVDRSFPATPSREDDRVQMEPDPGAQQAFDRRLRTSGIPLDHPLIIIHVSAGNPFRRWPETAFSDLAAALVTAAPDRFVLVTGGPSDREATARVLAAARIQAGAAAGRIHDAESLSLPELRAAMDRAALFVGGDSGPLHVASTSNVPIVGIFGPTTPERSAPWRPAAFPTISVDAGPLPCRPCDQRTCIPGDFRCLGMVTPESVRSGAEQLLALGLHS